MNEREEFEKWATNRTMALDRHPFNHWHDGEYRAPQTQTAWEAWQARAALSKPAEPSLKVCGACLGRGKKDIARGETAPCPDCDGTGIVGKPAEPAAQQPQQESAAWRDAERNKWKLVDGDCREGANGLITYHVNAFDEGYKYGIAAQSKDAEDAARYRHLRDCNSGSLVVVQILGMGYDDQVVLTEEHADAAIDAAIAQQKGKP